MPKLKENTYRFFWLAFFIIILFTQFSDTFLKHLNNSADFYIANDDARPQIAPFITYFEGKTPDYFDKYYLNALHPIFYKTLYFIASDLFTVNPAKLSKILPYILLSLFLIYAFRIGKTLGSNLISYALILVYLTTEIIFSRMVGGLPHSFGFLIIVSGVYYLLQKNYEKSFIVGTLGVGFYPACAIYILFSNIILIIFNKKLKELFPLILTSFFLCLLVALPSIISSFEYGGVVSRYGLESFPEADLGGRNSIIDLINGNFLFSLKLALGHSFFNSYGIYISPLSIAIITLLTLVTIISLIKNNNSENEPILILFFNCFILYGLALVFSPLLYFPERYLSYTFPVILPILFICALQQKLKEHKFLSEIIFLIAIFLTFSLGSKITANTGFNVNENDKKPVFEYISNLPENSLIAGYPKGIMDGVKYFSGKSFYMNYETSVPIHKKHMLEIRERAKKLFEAYYATDLRTLKNFAKETGVTHLVTDKNYLDIEHQIPYYNPLNSYISGAYEQTKDRNKELILLKLQEKAIFEYQDYFIIDLKTL